LHFSYSETPELSELPDFGDITIYSIDEKVIILSEKEYTGTVKVYDLLGQEILSDMMYNSTYKELDMKNTEGVYIVYLFNNNAVLNKKVFISR